MGLLDKVAAVRGRKSWSEPNLWDVERLRYPLLGSSSLASDREQIDNDFAGYVEGIYKRSGPVFALMAVRQAVFSEARFQFRRIRYGRPGDLFGTAALSILEKPWPGGTTGDLLARVLQDADLAGNAFVTIVGGRVRRLRPDWVTIVTASEADPDLHGAALDARIVGYLYSPVTRSMNRDARGATLLLPDQVAHFAPVPDPAFNWRGMSWITPLLREVSADSAATSHKLKFFEHGASPQMVVSLDSSITEETFRRFKAAMDEQHKGVEHAYKTLYLGGGADVTVVGADLKQLDFKATQGAGESRLAAAAGVPPVIAGFSEGLAGSSLNAGNYAASRRRFADATMRPLWRNVAGSLATLVDVPSDAELWFDERDISFLREDAADRAAILKENMLTIESGVRGGFLPQSVVAAVITGDLSLMEHTGLYSVQLQPPTTVQPITAPGPPGEE